MPSGNGFSQPEAEEPDDEEEEDLLEAAELVFAAALDTETDWTAELTAVEMGAT